MRPVNELARLVRSNKAAEIVKDVEESPAILRAVDDAGVPLVHVLALTNQLTVVKSNLDLETLETTWGPGWTVAHTAAQTRGLEPLIDLLDKHEHLLVWGANNDETPVHIAAKHANLDQLHNLLKDPSRLAIYNNLMETPVHIAAENNCLFQLNDCLTPGILAQRNSAGESALEVAEHNQCDGVIEEKLKRQTEILLGKITRKVEDAIDELGLKK
jgi:ankyrin repeat protein